MNDLSNEECDRYSLLLLDSHALAITNNLRNLHVKNSKIDYISTEGELEDIIIKNSSIGEVHSLSWTKQEGKFTNSHFEIVSNVRALFDLEISNSEINRITKEGIEISSQVVIQNTTIHILEEGAFNVTKGDLILRDVTFDQVSSSAFNVEQTGRLQMINVAFGNGSSNIINMNETGSVNLKNVTFGGAEMEWTVSLGLKDLKSKTKKQSFIGHPSNIRSTFIGILFGIATCALVFGVVQIIR